MTQELSRVPPSVPAAEADSVLHFLSHASDRLTASLEYESTLATVAEMALPYAGSWCIVDIAEADGSMRRLRVVHPDRAKQRHTRGLHAGWPPFRPEPAPLPASVQPRAAGVIPVVSDEMLVAAAASESDLQDMRALGIGSIIAVPLIARGHLLGGISFVSADDGHQYTETDVVLAEDLADRCSIALDNARLFRDLEAVRDGSAQLNEQLVIASLRQQELAEEARDANHAKSRFLATMSHEIRTPLNAIVGYAGLLEAEIAGPTTPGQRHYLERIRASSGHLIGLIDDILDLARVESGRMTLDRGAYPAYDSITAAVSLIDPQARSAGLKVVVRCRSANTYYLGDRDRVRQILVILLSNAVKFTDRGGRITVSCGTEQATDAEGNRGARLTFIRVEDTGIGISSIEAETVFQPFVQAEPGNTRKQGGAGLGLSIGLELARRMGGDLTLRSAPGKGSTFTLWLPVGTATGDVDA